MTVVKTFRYSADAEWQGGRLTRVSGPNKLTLEAGLPPEFNQGVDGVWSSEELLVGAVASSFAVTLAAVAERTGVELETIKVDGIGHVEAGSDGHYGFVAVELTVDVSAARDEDEESLERLIHLARPLCMVSNALNVPVHIRLATAPRVATALSAC
jgi:peroxiredoxin-like protein